MGKRERKLIRTGMLDVVVGNTKIGWRPYKLIRKDMVGIVMQNTGAGHHSNLWRTGIMRKKEK